MLSFNVKLFRVKKLSQQWRIQGLLRTVIPVWEPKLRALKKNKTRKATGFKSLGVNCRNINHVTSFWIKLAKEGLKAKR